ncbi:MAG: DUF1850 domain-containing protein [Thermodesulfobacteriota bacterium]
MKKIPLIFLAGGIIFSITYFVSLPILTLEKQGKIILWRVTKPGDTFLLGYLHSVAKTDVWEEFIIDNNYQIVLTQTMFQGQGAGLPYNLAENEKLIRDGPWFKITGMRRVLPELNWRVDAQWHSRFRFDREEIIPPAALYGDGVIQIKVTRMMLKDFFKFNIKKFRQRILEKNERYS